MEEGAEEAGVPFSLGYYWARKEILTAPVWHEWRKWGPECQVNEGPTWFSPGQAPRIWPRGALEALPSLTPMAQRFLSVQRACRPCLLEPKRTRGD